MRFNVVYLTGRIVLWNLPERDAREIAQSMGEGYGVSPV